jgi:hypothetical protein
MAGCCACTIAAASNSKSEAERVKRVMKLNSYYG